MLRIKLLPSCMFNCYNLYLRVQSIAFDHCRMIFQPFQPFITDHTVQSCERVALTYRHSKIGRPQTLDELLRAKIQKFIMTT